MVALEASLKRKNALEGSNPCVAYGTRVVYRIPTTPNYCPPQQQQQQPWVPRVTCGASRSIVLPPPQNRDSAGSSGQQPYYNNCSKPGHFSRDCRFLKASNQGKSPVTRQTSGQSLLERSSGEFTT